MLRHPAGGIVRGHSQCVHGYGQWFNWFSPTEHRRAALAASGPGGQLTAP